MADIMLKELLVLSLISIPTVHAKTVLDCGDQYPLIKIDEWSKRFLINQDGRIREGHYMEWEGVKYFDYYLDRERNIFEVRDTNHVEYLKIDARGFEVSDIKSVCEIK